MSGGSDLLLFEDRQDSHCTLVYRLKKSIYCILTLHYIHFMKNFPVQCLLFLCSIICCQHYMVFLLFLFVDCIVFLALFVYIERERSVASPGFAL